MLRLHTVISLFSAPALSYFNRCRTAGAKKREALNFLMANHGLQFVEEDATHRNKKPKETRNEEKNLQK